MIHEITPEFGSIMVIVPHPDDEILLCAGILHQAVKAGVPHKVVLATNGDYDDCAGSGAKVGIARLSESIKGLEMLGMDSENIFFMGYPDTGMPKSEAFLSRLYTEQNPNRILPGHVAQHTYGLPQNPDFHTSVHGVPAEYTREAFSGDLKELLLRCKPDNIFTTSLFDKHGDHSGLHLFIKEAVKDLKKECNYHPKIWSGVVHSFAGDDKWPERTAEIKRYTEPQYEAAIPLAWDDRTVFRVPDSMLAEDRVKNLKSLTLECHKSAMKEDAVDFLRAFIKQEEIFWLNQYE